MSQVATLVRSVTREKDHSLHQGWGTVNRRVLVIGGDFDLDRHSKGVPVFLKGIYNPWGKHMSMTHLGTQNV